MSKSHLKDRRTMFSLGDERVVYSSQVIGLIIYTGVIFCVGNLIAAIAPHQQFWVIFLGRLLFRPCKRSVNVNRNLQIT